MAMKRTLKTKERILDAALKLFNTEGEEAVGLVDVAAEIGISPGNLYYHFNGKESVLEALYENYEEEIFMVLNVPHKLGLQLNDHWSFIYIIFEEIYDFRFFYYNLASILDRCPKISQRFTRLMKKKEKSIMIFLDNLISDKIITASENQKRLITQRTALLFTFWFPHAKFSGRKLKSSHHIHEAVYAVLSQIPPYAGGKAAEYENLLLKKYQSVT